MIQALQIRLRHPTQPLTIHNREASRLQGASIVRRGGILARPVLPSNQQPSHRPRVPLSIGWLTFQEGESWPLLCFYGVSRFQEAADQVVRSSDHCSLLVKGSSDGNVARILDVGFDGRPRDFVVLEENVFILEGFTLNRSFWSSKINFVFPESFAINWTFLVLMDMSEFRLFIKYRIFGV